MSSKIKVLSITDSKYHFICIKDTTTNCNPYRLYISYPAQDRYGYYTRHKKCIAAYEDMCSILCHIRDIYLYSGFEHKDMDYILAWNDSYYGKIPKAQNNKK